MFRPHLCRLSAARVGLQNSAAAVASPRSRGVCARAPREKQNGNQLDFDSGQSVSGNKPLSELVRGWLVLKLFTYNLVVDNSHKLFSFSKRVLGVRLTERLLKATVMGQFSGGLSEEDATVTAKTLARSNIATIWNYSIEQDLDAYPEGEMDAHTLEQQERKYSSVNERYLRSIEMSAACNADHPSKFIAIKCTAIINPHLLRKLSLLVEGSRGLFQVLSSSGATDNLTDSRVAQETMNKELSPELRAVFPENSSPDIVDWCHKFGLLPSCIPQTHRLLDTEKSACRERLSESEVEQLHRFVGKIRDIGECASSEGVRVLVDAEQMYFESAIRHFTQHFLLTTFNHSAPVIYRTLQTYLTRSYSDLLEDLAIASRYGVKYGMKMVRGAYMEEERRLTPEGHASPVHPDKAATDRSYHAAMEKILKEVAKGTTYAVIASHNQETIERACDLISELGVSWSNGRVVFGQLKGMGDRLTYPLAQAGYLPNKVVVYGSIDDVMPFLIRRSQENRGVFENARSERKVYAQEIRRRLFG